MRSGGGVEPSTDELTVAWRSAQARLPLGWVVDSLRCASTGLEAGRRSDDWVAVAVGPNEQRREQRARDPVSALGGLADSFES